MPRAEWHCCAQLVNIDCAGSFEHGHFTCLNGQRRVELEGTFVEAEDSMQSPIEPSQYVKETAQRELAALCAAAGLISDRSDIYLHPEPNHLKWTLTNLDEFPVKRVGGSLDGAYSVHAPQAPPPEHPLDTNEVAETAALLAGMPDWRRWAAHAEVLLGAGAPGDFADCYSIFERLKATMGDENAIPAAIALSCPDFVEGIRTELVRLERLFPYEAVEAHLHHYWIDEKRNERKYADDVRSLRSAGHQLESWLSQKAGHSTVAMSVGPIITMLGHLRNTYFHGASLNSRTDGRLLSAATSIVAKLSRACLRHNLGLSQLMPVATSDSRVCEDAVEGNRGK